MYFFIALKGIGFLSFSLKYRHIEIIIIKAFNNGIITVVNKKQNFGYTKTH